MDVIIPQHKLKAFFSIDVRSFRVAALLILERLRHQPCVLTVSVAAGHLPEPADPGGGVSPHVGAAGAGLGAAGRREEPAGRPQQPARPGPGLGLWGPGAQAGEP